MGVVVLLVVGVALLVGLVTLPTVFDAVELFNVAVDTPLYDIIQILPYAFLGLIVIGIFWSISSRM